MLIANMQLIHFNVSSVSVYLLKLYRKISLVLQVGKINPLKATVRTF